MSQLAKNQLGVKSRGIELIRCSVAHHMLLAKLTWTRQKRSVPQELKLFSKVKRGVMVAFTELLTRLIQRKFARPLSPTLLTR